MSAYVPLTKADLKGFDKEARAMLLDAQARGERLRVTANGHCFVYGPNGGSTTVPPNFKTGNRTAANSRARVAALFRS